MRAQGKSGRGWIFGSTKAERGIHSTPSQRSRPTWAVRSLRTLRAGSLFRLALGVHLVDAVLDLGQPASEAIARQQWLGTRSWHWPPSSLSPCYLVSKAKIITLANTQMDNCHSPDFCRVSCGNMRFEPTAPGLQNPRGLLPLWKRMRYRLSLRQQAGMRVGPPR